ncbi:cytochrome P450 [Crepidotus variabilis]|uniref:Cytochrome P450 n=1 Tax=Crepidotus variabilis TaxID=179855 RepID=A0A9P6EM00_9AGAR|nr:cytochrome P450 [Crepidotus variabilis]
MHFILVGSFLVALFLIVRGLARPKRKFPPGPKGLPILGNLLDVPTDAVWKVYHEMAKKYQSPLIHLDILGSPIIVIDSLKVAQDLIENRSSIYSSRPRMPMMNELIGFDWHFAFIPYGKEWRDRRKVFHRLYDVSGSKFLRPYATRASRRLLLNLLDDPSNFLGHIRLQVYTSQLSGSFILATTYGLDITSMKDAHIMSAEMGMFAMGQAFHGYVVDHFPLLSYLPSWLPGCQFKNQAREWRQDTQAMLEAPFAFVKNRMSENKAPDSLAFRELSSMADEDPEQEKVVQDVFGAAYAGGSDTTVSALSSFVLAMLLYPEVQKKGQEAIDAVLLDERLPDMNDFGTIPYIDAILKEVLRWNPVAPLGVPYATLSDDTYTGYDIPAGATVYVNAWAMLHDADTYGPKPMDFRPERFLLENGELNPNIKDPDEAFGFGRRICPGQLVAQDSLWISIASILATFQIDKATSREGVPITPSGEFTPHLLSHPVPFECSITSRSTEAASLIRTFQLDLQV